MTQDDIIAMAREAGAIILDGSDTSVIQRLVQLAQAAERNKLAAWMQAQGYATGHGDTMEQLLDELRWQVRKSEREACLSCIKPNATPMEICDAIRARGQA
jgi:hypothetical protein